MLRAAGRPGDAPARIAPSRRFSKTPFPAMMPSLTCRASRTATNAAASCSSAPTIHRDRPHWAWPISVRSTAAAIPDTTAAPAPETGSPSPCRNPSGRLELAFMAPTTLVEVSSTMSAPTPAISTAAPPAQGSQALSTSPTRALWTDRQSVAFAASKASPRMAAKAFAAATRLCTQSTV